LQLDTTHPPPLEDVDDDVEEPLLLELAELPPLHAPALQVSLVCVQSVHVPPPVPHTVSIEPGWHVPVPSQQPVGQRALQEPPLESSPLLDVLLALLP